MAIWLMYLNFFILWHFSLCWQFNWLQLIVFDQSFHFFYFQLWYSIFLFFLFKFFLKLLKSLLPFFDLFFWNFQFSLMSPFLFFYLFLYVYLGLIKLLYLFSAHLLLRLILSGLLRNPFFNSQLLNHHSIFFIITLNLFQHLLLSFFIFFFFLLLLLNLSNFIFPHSQFIHQTFELRLILLFVRYFLKLFTLLFVLDLQLFDFLLQLWFFLFWIAKSLFQLKKFIHTLSLLNFLFHIWNIFWIFLNLISCITQFPFFDLKFMLQVSFDNIWFLVHFRQFFVVCTFKSILQQQVHLLHFCHQFLINLVHFFYF